MFLVYFSFEVLVNLVCLSYFCMMQVCIFAYGQTGSGKTYTMMGPPGRDQKGIIPRSLEQIFKTSQSLESQGWKYSMQVSIHSAMQILKCTFYVVLLRVFPMCRHQCWKYTMRQFVIC